MGSHYFSSPSVIPYVVVKVAHTRADAPSLCIEKKGGRQLGFVLQRDHVDSILMRRLQG